MDNRLTINAPSPAPVRLVPGSNCWCIEHAARIRFLVDAAEYFAALRAALVRARRSIFILGWDIDSRTRLVPGGANDAFPEELGDFLNALVATRKSLRVYVLSWDYAMLYMFERDRDQLTKLGAHRRVSFRLDGNHPLWASHHQKMVVIDDALAFTGGLDLTVRRWDTSAHNPDEPLRIDPEGKPYGPFHDVQAVADGGVASAFGKLVRERWRRATGKRCRALDPAPQNDPWPPELRADVVGINVAISRTEPEHEAWPAVTEIRQFYLDAIAGAKKWLYIENQYFSSEIIAEALQARLSEPNGPEIVMVSSRAPGDWLEQTTMGAMRDQLHHGLVQADVHGRYRAYSPRVSSAGPYLNVHSKVMIVDDTLVTVGSANLNNRSMGFDTECNVILQSAADARVRDAICALRSRLLAEHLDVDPRAVDQQLRRSASLVQTIETIRGKGRTLEPFVLERAPQPGEIILDPAIIDPTCPVAPGSIVENFVPEEARAPAVTSMWTLASACAIFAALAVAWHWTPLRHWIDIDRLVGLAGLVQGTPYQALAVWGAYVVAGILVIPVLAMIVVTGIAFGPLWGGLYAMGGVVLSAAVTYLIGRRLGHNTIRRMAGGRLERLSQRLGRHGLLAMIAVRVIPVAPFSIVNMAAGASHISFRHFMIGTVIGMAPGIAAMAVFGDRLSAALRHPTVESFGLLGLVVAAAVGGAIFLKRRFSGR